MEKKSGTKEVKNMGRDIRSFFGAKAGRTTEKRAVAKRPAEAIDLSDEDDKPIQEAKRVKSGAAATTASLPEKASPVKPAKKPPAKAATKSAPARAVSRTKSKVHVIDSDDDDEEPLLQKAEEEEDIEVAVDSDEEEPPKQKTARKAPTPSKPAAAKKSTPASKNSMPAKGSQGEAPARKPRKPKAEPLPPDVQAAMAAVDAAAAKLPDIEIDLMDGEKFGTAGAEAEPPHPGSKEVPRGHPECLRDKVFVITGVLDSLWRNEAEDLIKKHSGRVTGSISGKTTFLVTGTQAGRKKTATAVEKGTKIVDEDGLFALVRAAPEPTQAAESDVEVLDDDDGARPAICKPPAAVSKPPAAASTLPAATAKPAAALSRPGPSSSKAPPPGGNLGGGLNHTSSKPSANPGKPLLSKLASRPDGSRAADPTQQLWVEKHKPQRSDQLVGNPTVIANLREWLKGWEAHHRRGEAPPQAQGRGRTVDLSKKAVLLSGPPGIGKTSSAMIITRELGYTPVEVNASDTRNKADSKIVAGIGGRKSNVVKELATNAAIGVDPQGRKIKTCLIMDEVDGMSAGDRGGVADLINTIKGSKVPIICICNDKYSQKLKSLRNYTVELDFRMPTKDQITKRMLGICRAEGLAVNEATLNAVAEGANGDIRLILGQLQMIRLRANSLLYDQAKGKMGTSKDADMSPFMAASKLLSMETTRMSLIDRTELVFQDMDLVPLLIQENYLYHRPHMSQSNEALRMRMVARAADAFSSGDIVNRSVRQYQNWGLMPFAATIGSVLPAFYMRGSRETFFPGEMNFPRFSAWLGQNSSFGKQKRLLGELHTRMSASGTCSADRTSLRTDYLPTLRRTLVKPLRDSEKEGIPPVIAAMQDYCLNKDDHTYIQDVTHFKSREDWNKDEYKDVPTAVKTAFTRELNKTIAHQRPKSNVMIEEFKRKRGGKRATAAAADADEEDGMVGDPELEAAEAAAREAKADAEDGDEEDGENEEMDPKDVAALEKKQRQLQKRGITFEAKGGASKAKKPAGRGSGAARAGANSGSNRGRARGRGAKAK